MSTFRATASRQARSLCASQRISSSSSRVASWAAARPSAGVALPRSLNNSVSLRWYSAEATKEESKKEEQQSTSSGDSKDSQSELKAVQEQHAKALEAKDGEIAKLKEGLMKTLADFENLQKTTSRDIANAKEFAISKFAGELVNSVDVLELAIGAATKQKAAESDATADFNSLLEGVQMTHGNLEKTLSRHGVTKFDPKGEKFDPNKHEALFMVPAAATGPDGIKESGVVMDTQKTGWMFKSRVLRAAQVGVVQ